MNWKKFKQSLNKTEDESCFILGLDLGNSTSAMAYYDFNTKQPTVIDISGGYSKPTVPTVMQYIMDTREWVFGEYAILNRDSMRSVTIDSLIDRLGRKEYIDIGDRPISVVNVLSLYLKELIGNVKNINPKAEIAGIVVSIPSYLSEDVKDELRLAFKNAGYEKELIALVPDRECIFARHYNNTEILPERLMLLDLGSRELRGGVYDVKAGADVISMDCISSLFSEGVGTNKLDEAIEWMFMQMYCINMNITSDRIDRQTKEHLKSFLYQYKDLLFQKNLDIKPVRLYFNFAYPPFQQSVTKADIDEITSDYKSKFNSFINQVLEKNIYDNQTKISTSEIDTVLCTGGGFEMIWVRETINSLFTESNKTFFKNSKSIVAEGAALIAALYLEVIKSRHINVKDENQITSDFGVNIIKDKREKFVPVIERNSFWWQKHEPKMFIINEKTSESASMELIRRDSGGDMHIIDTLRLDGLPDRPAGTTRIKLSMQFVNHEIIEATAVDSGFGELFPKTDYTKRIMLSTRA